MNKFWLACFLFLAASHNLAAQGFGISRPDAMFAPISGSQDELQSAFPGQNPQAPNANLSPQAGAVNPQQDPYLKSLSQQQLQVVPAQAEITQSSPQVNQIPASQIPSGQFPSGQFPSGQFQQPSAAPQMQMIQQNPAQMMQQPPREQGNSDAAMHPNAVTQPTPQQQIMTQPQTIPDNLMLPPQNDYQSMAAPIMAKTKPMPAKIEANKKDLTIFDARRPTPSRFFTADISMPDHFSTSNNLAKKVGSFYRAFGEVIFIQGNVVDSFGVPIEGAIVEIWQANAAGKYHTLLDPDSEYIDRYFNMSGRAVTDNLGGYDFITIMPGSSPGRAPHINVNVYHPKFGKIETEMYFAEHPYNLSDYQYMAYGDQDRRMLTALVRRSNLGDQNSIKICTFNIVMRGVHQYKTY